MSTEQQAALLEEIASMMREKPEDGFLQFERRCQSHWRPITSWRYLMSDLKDCPGDVRLRPRTITIAGIEVPEPMREAPPKGTQYHCPDLLERGEVSWVNWSGQSLDYQYLARGICHYTEDAARQHARALILASGGEVG